MKRNDIVLQVSSKKGKCTHSQLEIRFALENEIVNRVGEVVVRFELVAEILRAGIVVHLIPIGVRRCRNVTQPNEYPIDFVEFFTADFELVHRMLFTDFVVLPLAFRID